MSSGYSKTPLLKKLGFKPGMNCSIYTGFPGLMNYLTPLPHKVVIDNSLIDDEYDIILWCVNDVDILKHNIHELMLKLRKSGMIWVIWYKKSSQKQRTVNEDTIRSAALALGLVDVKVCAVDNEWSGLKLVYRLDNR